MTKNRIPDKPQVKGFAHGTLLLWFLGLFVFTQKQLAIHAALFSAAVASGCSSVGNVTELLYLGPGRLSLVESLFPLNPCEY